MASDSCAVVMVENALTQRDRDHNRKLVFASCAVRDHNKASFLAVTTTRLQELLNHRVFLLISDELLTLSAYLAIVVIFSKCFFFSAFYHLRIINKIIAFSLSITFIN